MMQPNSRNERVTELFTTWRRPMLRYICGRFHLPASDLDDVAQEVFARLLKYSDDTLIEHPQSYLFHIATNVVIERSERYCHRKPHEPEWLDALVDEEHAEPEVVAEQAMEAKHVAAAVRQLPQRQQTIVMMHVMHGQTYQEIAKNLGITKRVTRRDLARAYARLRELLTEGKQS